MDCFTAIDFETAQGYHWSICQVGLVRVEYGKITNEINILVQPPDNYYWDRFIDFPVLKKTLEYYGMQTPDYEKHCTYRIFKDNLASLCRYYKIQLNHHDALSDAKAYAELFLIHLQKR
ncbi:MAG: hypothetical protein PF436_11075 [Prolixibacteraceae bacterium]|jgi:DNA polymerase-3 subunit epsilon|nr:hypothetical protein [Prolixibacteraceae bacterium]